MNTQQLTLQPAICYKELYYDPFTVPNRESDEEEEENMEEMESSSEVESEEIEDTEYKPRRSSRRSAPVPDRVYSRPERTVGKRLVHKTC